METTDGHNIRCREKLSISTNAGNVVIVWCCYLFVVSDYEGMEDESIATHIQPLDSDKEYHLITCLVIKNVVVVGYKMEVLILMLFVVVVIVFGI